MLRMLSALHARTSSLKSRPELRPQIMRLEGERASAARPAPTADEVVNEIQSDTARTDSRVRVRYAQPASPMSARTHIDTRLDAFDVREVARAMEHQTALLLGCFGLHKPHVGPGDRLADGFGVSSIVLLPLDVRSHVSRWHQPHSMAKRPEFARPMMR